MAYNIVKDMFIEYSGRTDLDNSDPTGAIWYINAGQRLLDSIVGFDKAKAKVVIPLAAGQSFATTRWCRAIESAILADGTGRKPLERRTAEELIVLYPDSYTNLATYQSPPTPTIATENLSEPVYWAPWVNAFGPDQNQPNNALSWRYGAEGVIAGDNYIFKTIMIAPPPESAYSLLLEGYFFSAELQDDYDKSFWTELYPHTLVDAACLILERAMRNSEGQKDKLEAIKADLLGIDKDYALQESHNQMEG